VCVVAQWICLVFIFQWKPALKAPTTSMLHFFRFIFATYISSFLIISNLSLWSREYFCGITKKQTLLWLTGWLALAQSLIISYKKHLKNVGPIRHCEPPHAHSPSVASGTVARRLRIDVHDDDNNDNAWQRGPLWPHGMGPMMAACSVSPWTGTEITVGGTKFESFVNNPLSVVDEVLIDFWMV